MGWLRITTAGCLAAASACAPAFAAGTPRVRLSVSVAPVVITGQSVRIRGALHAPRGRVLRVRVQQRSGGAWTSGSRLVAVRGRRRFSLTWRAPAYRGVVRLRAVAVSGGRIRAASRPAAVAVSAIEVLSPGRVEDAPAPGHAGTLRYRGAAWVRPGEFVALDVGDQTPAGLLGHVEGVRPVPGGTLVDLRPASITEAVPAGRIATDGGGAALRAAQSSAAPRDFRSALGCSGGVHGRVTGSLRVALAPRLALAWTTAGVTSARASVTVRGHAELSAALDAAAACSLAQTAVGTWDAPPVRFFAGPIPVVIVPRTTLFVSAEARAEAAVEAGISGELTATAGLRYSGAAHPIGSFEPRFSATGPKSRADASVGARLVPSITFLIYGQAGPRFDLSTGLQLDASGAARPWWKLAAPVELSAGFSVPRLSSLEIPQRTVFSRSFPIAQAAGGVAPAAGPDPLAPADPRVERARISWDTSGSDVDLHMWDTRGNHAWFGNPDAVPGARLLGDDTDGFGPEVFSAPAGEPLTYGLCYFDDRDTGPVRVAVTITDANGAAAESSEVLTRKHDHLLIAGDGEFVPPEGWCPG